MTISIIDGGVYQGRTLNVAREKKYKYERKE